jgi:hypothetical protein
MREVLHLLHNVLVGCSSFVGLSSKSQMTPTSMVTTTTSCLSDTERGMMPRSGNFVTKRGTGTHGNNPRNVHGTTSIVAGNDGGRRAGHVPGGSRAAVLDTYMEEATPPHCVVRPPRCDVRLPRCDVLLRRCVFLPWRQHKGAESPSMSSGQGAKALPVQWGKPETHREEERE